MFNFRDIFLTLTTLCFWNGSSFTWRSFGRFEVLCGGGIRAGLGTALTLTVRMRMKWQVPEALPDLPRQVIGCIRCFLVLLPLRKRKWPSSKISSDSGILFINDCVKSYAYFCKEIKHIVRNVLKTSS